MPRGRTLAVAGTVVVVGGFAATYALFFTPNTPDKLALSKQSTPAASTVASTTIDPTGTWIIAGGSTAGYRVREKLARLPAPSDAVGRTTAVTGGLTVETVGQDYAVKDIKIQVDLSKLVSDSPKRDYSLRSRGLETDKYPTAVFEGSRPITLSANVSKGQAVDLTLEGMLTIHDTARQVSVPVRARLSGQDAEVAGSFTFPMSEFGITPPSIANIVSVEPTGTMEFRLVLAKAT